MWTVEQAERSDPLEVSRQGIEASYDDLKVSLFLEKCDVNYSH